MDDPVEEPFAEDHWQADLAFVIKEHDLDQFAGIDSDVLAEHLATVAGSLVRLIKTRDRGMPEALNAVERAELAALRKTNRLMEVTSALAERTVADLEVLLKDARAERDRAVRASAEVFVLEFEVEHEGVRLIEVCASEQAAVFAAQRYFEDNNYSSRYDLGEWVDGVAYFLYKEDRAHRKAGDRSDHCFGIVKRAVLVK